jgi:predicted thioesterase
MGEVGWILHKDYWKLGYGTEISRGLVRYGFEDLKLGRIQAPCAAVNYGSYRIMERAGMRREALHRKAFWARVDKEWIDEVWYAILAEDYFAEPSPFIGKTASAAMTVTEADTAKTVGSGSLDLLATPVMIALMERAACECLAGILEPNQTSVGSGVDVEHTAASPLGAVITATAAVINADGRKIKFEVSAKDAKGEIGRGTHDRIIVDGERLMEKARGRSL